MPSNPATNRARELRQRQTKAESLLGDAVRAKRLCGLKFRRQYAIGPFFADFACVARKLIVELDGGYHDYQSATSPRTCLTSQLPLFNEIGVWHSPVSHAPPFWP